MDVYVYLHPRMDAHDEMAEGDAEEGMYTYDADEREASDVESGNPVDSTDVENGGELTPGGGGDDPVIYVNIYNNLWYLC